MKDKQNHDQQLPEKLMESIRQGIKKARRNNRYSQIKKLNKMAAIVKEQASV